MTIDKDLAPVYKAMVKTSYAPVIRRVIILHLMQDINRMQMGMKMDDTQFIEILHSYSGKQALKLCLNEIFAKRGNTIQELLLQYGINTDGGLTDFYHEEFDRHFREQIAYVMKLVFEGDFALMDSYIANPVEH